MNYQPEKNQAFINDFNTSNEVGKVGEQAFPALMARHFPDAIVEDVSGDRNWQYKEVDYIIHWANGKTSMVEVKTDTNSWSPNFAIEITANKEINRKGWLHTSHANTLCYYFPNGLNGKPNMFMIDMNELRNVVRNNPQLKDVVAKPERQLRGEGMKTTVVTLVPRTMVKPLAAYVIDAVKVTNSHSAQAGWNR